MDTEARWGRRGMAEGTTGEQEEHKSNTRGTHEQHERAPPNLLASTLLAPRLHLARGPQSPPNHTALKWLQRGFSPALVGSCLRAAQTERATRCRVALPYCTNIYSRD